MSIEGILVGLLAIVIGAAWAFYGLKLFTILLPIWAFFFGLVTGAQWAADVFGKGDAGFFSPVCRGGSASSSASCSRRSRSSGMTPRRDPRRGGRLLLGVGFFEYSVSGPA